MARILVTGDTQGIASRTLLERLVEHIRNDGHDAALAAEVHDPAQEVRDADAVIAVLDAHGDADAAALLAYATAHAKPALGLVRRGAVLPRFLRAMCTKVTEVERGGDIRHALPPFYDHIRPFSGRLVRDHVPDLVKEAGHRVQFRALEMHELPRFLKRKITEEAKSVHDADGSDEIAELADLLEAVEAFIEARGVDRAVLQEAKDRKKSERGGFERGFVVETALTDAPRRQPASDEPTASPPRSNLSRSESTREERATNRPEPTQSKRLPGLAQRARAQKAPPGYDGPVWEADDAVPASEVEKSKEKGVWEV